MASTALGGQPTSGTQTDLGYDMKLEVVTLPVSDVDRAKRFYQSRWDWYAAYASARKRGSSEQEAAAAAGRYMAEVKHVVVSNS